MPSERNCYARTPLSVEVKHKTTGKVIEVIKRIPFHKGFVGNFVPVYVRYKSKVYFLHGGWDYAYMHGTPTEAWIEV